MGTLEDGYYWLTGAYIKTIMAETPILLSEVEQWKGFELIS